MLILLIVYYLLTKKRNNGCVAAVSYVKVFRLGSSVAIAWYGRMLAVALRLGRVAECGGSVGVSSVLG